MKKSQLILATISLPLDYLALILAGIIAYNLRYLPLVTNWLPVIFNLTWIKFFPLLAIVAISWIALFAIYGLYGTDSRLKAYEELRRIFLACTTGLALIIVWFFFNQSLFSSRFIILVFWISAIILVNVTRSVLRLIRNFLYKKGYALTKLVIIGSDNNTQALVNLFNHNKSYGYQVVVAMPKFDKNRITELKEIDEIMLVTTQLDTEERLNIWEFCNEHHLNFKYVADLFNTQIHNVVFHTYAGLPILEIKRTPLDGWGKVAKRLVDIILATIFIIILSPVMLFVAAVISLKYGRPIIVSLPRIGEKGKPFILHKFRSMVIGADKMKKLLMTLNERNDGPLFKLTKDPRVLPFGKFIRSWSIDELPQLFDVLCGRLSLVGPRPHEPQEVAQYQTQHKKVLGIKPGLTGLAQISGRSSLSFADEVRLDSFYIENWSISYDLLILVKTVIVICQRRHAT